ncbi:MAG TPA: hypothetical protein VKP67_21715 [Xanthobacteraceae bacterium]|nr:hypothetical protein [Xanthobacteraceae bacterium]
MAYASVPALAQDFTAGKTPAQLFNSDCAECHHSPAGLARNRDVRTLAGFLREHYTTKSETAGALAVYVSGFAGDAAVARQRGAGAAEPANTPSERSRTDRRNRSEAAGTGEDAHANARPVDEPAGRRRRATNLSGEGEKRRGAGEEDVLRPPGAILTTPAADAGSPDSTAKINTVGERPQTDRRPRSDSEVAGTGEDARPNARPAEDPAGRRRRTTNLPSDNEKRRARSDGDMPRSLGVIIPSTARSRAPAADAADSATPDAVAPVSAAGERSRTVRRPRSDSEVAGTGEDARPNARPAEDPAGRRRRITGLPGDGEKRRARSDSDVPRPPANLATAPAAVKLNTPTGDRTAGDTTAPISRLRSYLSSGLGLESTIAEAAKMGTPKARKRRNHSENAETHTPDEKATGGTVADAPATGVPSATINASTPAQPRERDSSPDSAAATPTAAPRAEP